MNKKVLAWCGVLAPIVFIVSLVIFSLLTPHYSNLTNAVSELGTLGAPSAFAWNILGFLLVGLLIIAYAWGMYLDLRHSIGGIVVPILVGISGIGFAGLGLFPGVYETYPFVIGIPSVIYVFTGILVGWNLYHKVSNQLDGQL